MDNTLTNNISQHVDFTPSGRIRGAETSVSNTELVGSCALSSTPQVAGEEELQPKGLTQDVACRKLPVYCWAYVDGFVQGVKATVTVDMGAVNSIISHRLLRQISKDHCSQLAKTAPVDVAGGESLMTYGKAIVEIHMGPLCFEHECCSV